MVANLTGRYTRTAAADITAGTILKMNESKQFEVAGTSDTAVGLYVAGADAKEGRPVVGRSVARGGGATVVATAGTYTTGEAVYLADEGKVASSGSTKIGNYVGVTETLDAEGEIEIDLSLV